MTDVKPLSMPKIKTKQKKKAERKNDGKKKAKRRSQREWSKGNAILVKASDQTTYADILEKLEAIRT